MLPFETTFFQHALLGGLFASLLCGVVGTYIVTRRMVIVGGGMAHASLGGVGMGAYFGFAPLGGAAAFAALSGFLLNWLGRKRSIREDSAVAMIWTFGMATGILFACLAPGFMTDLPAYLFGDILSISATSLRWLALFCAVVVALYLLLRGTIVSIACDRDFARTQGLPVCAVETLFTLLTALTIVACLHLVGIIMVVSLLSVPQLTASLFVRRYDSMVWLSAVWGFVACVAGLCLSYWFDVPSGAAIILVGIAIYALARAIKSLCLSLRRMSKTTNT